MNATGDRTTSAAPAPPADHWQAASLADAAVAYAALGWRIFPVQPLGKLPRFRRAHADDEQQRACPGGQVCGSLGHGFKDASADPDRIARWWARWPDSNIGVATGDPRAVGVGAPGHSPDVLDVDVKGGAPGRASLDRLLAVGMVRGAWATSVTPSGGWHYWYGGTVQPSAVLKQAGIDFRSCGGYVLAPRSVVRVAETNEHDRVVHAVRPYRWTFMDLSRERELSWADVRDFLVPPPQPKNLWSNEALPDHATPIIRWFAAQPAGSRNDSLFWAACRVLESGYGEQRLDDLVAEARTSGLSEAEIRKTVGSARRRVLGGAA